MPTPLSLARRAMRWMRFAPAGRRGAFEDIFRNRYWGSEESVSGCGSSLSQTQHVRRELPAVVSRFGIRSIFDAPCGDLYWMKHVLPTLDVDYLGGDIVQGVVDIARENNTSPRAKFTCFDIAEDPFPAYDLWRCRDVLFHLSYSDIRGALINFANSECRYILVTTHTGDDVVNRNMVTGDFRRLDLFQPPFELPEDKVLYRFEDYYEPMHAREMVLFARKDVIGSMST